ncbi:urease accessory protein UreG, partial [Streptomyces decoyicus]
LVVNKTDLAPYVGSDLEGMARDAKVQRGHLPVAFTSLKGEGGVKPVADWARERLTNWTAGPA